MDFAPITCLDLGLSLTELEMTDTVSDSHQTRYHVHCVAFVCAARKGAISAISFDAPFSLPAQRQRDTEKKLLGLYGRRPNIQVVTEHSHTVRKFRERT